MEKLTLEISGMSCGHCVGSVSKALQALAGVEVEAVAIGSATMQYDPAAVTREQIADAVADQGYEVVAAR